ncbi:MAG: hypothetical protein KDD45_09840 [Bdellovibrionales bacterium]|nr:hypothetical protein [Bdellovibrionales bacterium]
MENIMKKTGITLLSFLTLNLVSCDFVQTTGVTETVASGSGSVDSSSVQPPSDFTVSNDSGSASNQDGNSTLPPAPTQDPNYVEGFSINNDAERTASVDVTLQLRTLIPFQIKVGYENDCSDGSWASYMESLPWQLRDLNTTASTVTVRFKDWEGGLSPCYRRSIIHDNEGPDILFQKYPQASLEEGSAVDLSINVSDKLSKVTSVTCKLDAITTVIEKNCYEGLNNINIPGLPRGHYVFTVTASDELNNTSTQEVSWDINSSVKNLTQELYVDDYKKVDVLFVIDNSGSMQYEQKSMASRTSQFISVLKGLDYQLAVTTTDPRDISLGDGRLIPIKGTNGRYIIDSSEDEATAQTELSNTLQRSETGSPYEQGIRAVYRALERYVLNDNHMRSFIRDNSQLAVVVISDEDESANTSMNDPQSVLNLISDTWNTQKRFSFHSIITKPGDTACRSTYGATYGERYKAFSNLTGGIIGSVCEMDYAEQVKGIANGIRNLLKTITLQCEPVSGYPIKIYKEGALIQPTYTVEGVNLKFDTELDPGKYSVDYTCLK